MIRAKVRSYSSHVITSISIKLGTCTLLANLIENHFKTLIIKLLLAPS